MSERYWRRLAFGCLAILLFCVVSEFVAGVMSDLVVDPVIEVLP